MPLGVEGMGTQASGVEGLGLRVLGGLRFRIEVYVWGFKVYASEFYGLGR